LNALTFITLFISISLDVEPIWKRSSSIPTLYILSSSAGEASMHGQFTF